MKVILANPRGFCAGVNMAIESLDQALARFGAPVYVYHEIVHNRPVVEQFKAKGAIFVNAIEEVPEKAVLLYSAHGVSPAIRQATQERAIKAIDATCPLVTKVHTEAIRFAKEGYTIILIGHEGHDEVVGTMGEAPKAIRLVENVEDVNSLDLPADAKLAYLSQTTLSVNDASKIIEALKKHYPGIVGPPKEDICYATQNRQEAVHLLAQEANLVLVLGSVNSSNSQRLVEIARAIGKPAHLIDGVDEMEPGWFDGVQTVVITAGASAPEDVVQKCVQHLGAHYGATVEEWIVREEDVQFGVPKELH